MTENFDVSPYCGQKKLAIDIGCNISCGENWIERFLDRGFKHVVGFEPNPVGWDKTYAQYKDNGRVTLHHIAIATWEHKSITMKSCHDLDNQGRQPGGGWIATDTTPQDKRPSFRNYEVIAHTLDHFKLKPEVIKIDVDGCDLDVLKSSEITLQTCACVIIEHRYDREKIDDFLIMRGFTKKKTSGNDSFYVRLQHSPISKGPDKVLAAEGVLEDA